jgi:hypothetical protein
MPAAGFFALFAGGLTSQAIPAVGRQEWMACYRRPHSAGLL